MLSSLMMLARNEARRIWCYRWLVAAVTLVLGAAATTYVLRLPDIYDAWGQIYVNRQTPLATATEGVSLVGENYGSPYVVQKTLLNDSNLEKVVRRMDPAAAAGSRAALEAALNRLRSKIHFAPDPGDGFVELHVTDADPVRARDLARLLLDQFVSGNLDRAQTDLGRAGQFLDEQIASYGAMLAASQSRIEEFRRTHPAVAALPLRTDEQPADEPLPPPPPSPTDLAAASLSASLSGRVAELEEKLTSLRAAYTEQYPDVVATRQQLAEAIAARDALPAPAVPVTARRRAKPSRQTIALPRPPAETSAWADLQKSDELLRNNYQELLAKRAAAQMSRAVYGADSSGKYQMTRAPTVPAIPTGPKRGLYLALAGLLAVGGGLGAGYLRAATKGIFVSPQELENALQLPVIGTVSWEPAWHTRRVAPAPATAHAGGPTQAGRRQTDT